MTFTQFSNFFSQYKNTSVEHWQSRGIYRSTLSIHVLLYVLMYFDKCGPVLGPQLQLGIESKHNSKMSHLGMMCLTLF